jgi:glc operon protein GlcG
LDLFKPTRRLTLEAARLAGETALKHAEAHGWSITVVIVDLSGLPIWYARMTDCTLAAVPGASMKAKSALTFGRPTSALEAAVAGGKPHYFAFDDTLPVTGGLPIVVDGDVIGGIGVGGGPGGREAVACAEAALESIGLARP